MQWETGGGLPDLCSPRAISRALIHHWFTTIPAAFSVGGQATLLHTHSMYSRLTPLTPCCKYAFPPSWLKIAHLCVMEEVKAEYLAFLGGKVQEKKAQNECKFFFFFFMLQAVYQTYYCYQTTLLSTKHPGPWARLFPEVKDHEWYFTAWLSTQWQSYSNDQEILGSSLWSSS